MNDLIQWLTFMNCQYILISEQLKIFSDGTISEQQLNDILKICQRNNLRYGINLTGNYILIY